MSCLLPPEMLDHIVDHLHDEPPALRMCCLVSKSWVPRSRVHPFAYAKFNTSTYPIESWMKTFPDPSNSPARYTRILIIHGHVTTVVGADIGRWIRAFHNVVQLHVRNVRGHPFVLYHLPSDHFAWRIPTPHPPKSSAS